MEHYLIETKIGCIYGRDAIYLDEINHNYAKRKLKFVGEINGACCSGTDDESFIKFSLEFQGVFAFNSTELDIYCELKGDNWYEGSFVEIKESELLNTAKKVGGSNLKSYLIQTYDDVFEIVCEKYNFKIEK